MLNTLVNNTSALIAATLGNRKKSQANGEVICHRYHGRFSARRWSASCVGFVTVVSIKRRTAVPVPSPGRLNGIRHALRVGWPIRPRMTTYIAVNMNHSDPKTVIRPIRRSRRMATKTPKGTTTSDTSSLTSSDSTTNTA